MNDTVRQNFVFPIKSLPDCFTNDDLLKQLDDIYNEFNDTDELIKNNFDDEKSETYKFKGTKNLVYDAPKGAEPIHFTISKSSGGNRIMSVSNPIILIILHKFILDNKDVILGEQSESCDIFYSSSHFLFEDDEIEVLSDYDDYKIQILPGNFFQNSMGTNLIKKIKLSNGRFYCLNMDIANFYNSIYTHMISWNVEQSYCKQIFDNLDVFNRILNYNETKGILIGPYTSAMFSELILSKIDRKLIEFCKENDIVYERFCDDYSFFSDSKETLENKLQSFFDETLSKYKLDINYSKTQILDFPFSEDCFSIKQFTIDFIDKLKSDCYSSMTKIELIINAITMLLNKKYYYCNYFLEALHKYDFANCDEKEELEVLLDFIFNIVLKNDLTIKKSFQLIQKIVSDKKMDITNLIYKWIDRSEKITLKKNNILDIWLLYLIVYYKVVSEKTDKYVKKHLGNNELGDILIFEYASVNNKVLGWKKEIKEYLNRIDADISSQYSQSKAIFAYFSKYWLLFYTNNVKWKINEIKGFKEGILKVTSFEHIKNLKDNRLQLLFKMAEKNVAFFKF